MKVNKIIIYIFLFLVYSNYANSQSDTSQKIDLNVNNATINELINKIETQVDYRFYFDTSQLINERFTIQIHQKSLNAVLIDLLIPHKIYFSIDREKHIFLTKDQVLNITLAESFFTNQVEKSTVIEIGRAHV